MKTVSKDTLSFLTVVEMMKEIINRELATIEEKYSVKIIYACEAGSRSTGLSDATSDYDVRFVYLRPVQWYLSVEKQKNDVISLPINAQLDFVGWDLQKALLLLRKSNPSFMEWLQSPTYYENTVIMNKIKALIPNVFSARTCYYHYLNMSKSNYKTILKEKNISVKSYLNVIRPLLFCKWLETKQQFPPILFQRLLEVCKPAIRSDVEALGDLKKGQMVTPNFELLNTYIEKELIHLEGVREVIVDHSRNTNSDVNEIFLFALQHIWQIKM